MHSMNHADAPVKTFAALAGRLADEGFEPGAPKHITPRTRAIDSRLCGRRRCPGCRSRGLRHHAYHRGRRYRVLASCATCNFAEEV
jgi:hypothetical protein